MVSGGRFDGHVRPNQIFSVDDWSIASTIISARDNFVRWLYRSDEIAFQFWGFGYDTSAASVIPPTWRIPCVGIMPGVDDETRWPRERQALVLAHCHNIKHALPYWGTESELPYLPEVHIDDPYWPIKL
jgi:hypothetical protein